LHALVAGVCVGNKETLSFEAAQQMLLQKGVQFVCGLNGELARGVKRKDGSARLAAFAMLTHMLGAHWDVAAAATGIQLAQTIKQ
jgi:hypothetical protein